MQIRTIALYGTSGGLRTLDFELGAVNIITGRSGTGKSSIVDILDYCLCRSTFNVFEGEESDAVAWYGVVLRIEDGDVFIAKPAPEGRARTQSRAHFATARRIELPTVENLNLNSSDEAVRQYLDRALGMVEGQTVVREGRTTQAFQPNIKHTKHYLRTRSPTEISCFGGRTRNACRKPSRTPSRTSWAPSRKSACNKNETSDRRRRISHVQSAASGQQNASQEM